MYTHGVVACIWSESSITWHNANVTWVLRSFNTNALLMVQNAKHIRKVKILSKNHRHTLHSRSIRSFRLIAWLTTTVRFTYTSPNPCFDVLTYQLIKCNQTHVSLCNSYCMQLTLGRWTRKETSWRISFLIECIWGCIELPRNMHKVTLSHTHMSVGCCHGDIPPDSSCCSKIQDLPPMLGKFCWSW